MPPKPKAKPRLVARRGAAVSSSTSTPTPDDVATSAESSEPTTTSNNDTSAAPASAAATEDSAPPAPTPQETTAVAPPKGRLDSLASASTSRSGSAAPKPTLKFKPKVVARRTKEERQALESKFADAVPSSSVEPTTSSRGRGTGSRGPRGRGRGGRGGFSDRFKDPAPSTASGPFALGSVVSTGAQKVMAERGHRFQSSSHKQSSGFKFRQQHLRRIKADPNGTGAEGLVEEESSSDESETERIDVELIGLLDEESQDEDGDQKMDADAHWGAGAPVRIPRREHVDRQAMVNTDSSTKKNKAAAAQEKAKEMTFEADIKIKDESDEDGDVAMSDIPSHGASSPEMKKKVRMSRSPEARRKSSASGTSPVMKRRRSSSHKKKPVLSTTEEKEEFERGEEDRLSMLRELGGALPEVKPAIDSESAIVDGESSAAGEAAAGDAPPTTKNEETENQIFFFQFPTLLPELSPVSTSADDSIAVDSTPAAETKPDPDAPAAPVRKAPPPHSRAALKATLARLSAPPPSGHIGQLRVHRSGRITLLYGHGPDAFEMEVNRGASCEFLQEVVVMKEESPYGEDDKDEKGNRKGVAYSLGQVKGKYVVNPDFEKLIAATSGAGGRGGRAARRKSEAGEVRVKSERRGSSARRGSMSGKGKAREEAIVV